MGDTQLHVDIAIIGGGAAALWTLNHLRGRGYSAVLLAAGELGGEQTLAAQGIIHSGVKYSLQAGDDADAGRLAAMPATWRRLLAGDGAVDLREVVILSEHMYLCSTGELPVHLRGVAAPAQRCPAAFRNTGFNGHLWRLDEPVIDPHSLVQVLAAQQAQHCFAVDWRVAGLDVTGEGMARLRLPGLTLAPRMLLLAAGAGNGDLVRQLGGASPAIQRRPLQQVWVKHDYPHAIFCHFPGAAAEPRLTVTSHHAGDGRTIWSLGGALATGGATQQAVDLLRHARREVATLLPWIDLGASQWAALAVDRAEPGLPPRSRPRQAFLGPLDSSRNTLVAWPGKLCLCPDLGERVEQSLRAAGVAPAPDPDLAPLSGLGRPPLAPPPWERLRWEPTSRECLSP